MKNGTSEAGCYLILSGQGCDDLHSFLQTRESTYNNFFDYCVQIAGKEYFHLTRLDIAIDDKPSDLDTSVYPRPSRILTVS